MAKVAQIVASLQKLYDKRALVDKRIMDVEKSLVDAVEKAEKTVKATPAKAVKKVTGAVKKTVGRPRGRRPANP